MSKILVMPDSFKGTMTAEEVSGIISSAVREKYPEMTVEEIPMADGGEGTIECFHRALGGEIVSCTVSDAFFEKKETFYWKKGETAVIELAKTAGYSDEPGRRDPSAATTYGVGEMILHSVKNGAKKVFIALGGSCTNDGGAGMICAAGAVFKDEEGHSFIPVGRSLKKIRDIDVEKLKENTNGISFTVLCDVDNPLYGENGAACVFGPQKGADPAMVRELDENLRAYAGIIRSVTGVDVSEMKGGGAAGGTAAGAAAFLDARIRSGIDTILDMTGFEEKLAGCDMIITGEGRFDSQSLDGKVIGGIAARAKKRGVPVTVIAGCTKGDINGLEKTGITEVIAASNKKYTHEELLKNCRTDLENAVTKWMGEKGKCF